MADFPLITFDDIATAMAGISRLILLQGVERDAYLRHCGLDPDGLETAAAETAQEPFELHHGLGDLSVGSLYNLGLSARQREAVREELNQTYQVAFITALTLTRAQQHGAAAAHPQPKENDGTADQ